MERDVEGKLNNNIRDEMRQNQEKSSELKGATRPKQLSSGLQDAKSQPVLLPPTKRTPKTSRAYAEDGQSSQKSRYLCCATSTEASSYVEKH